MKFTIAIPAFKAKFLHEAIDSCLWQSYSNLEIVIVDDASPENLATVVNQFSDPRIMYYRNEKNCGAVNVVDNWNICLSYAKGDYIICMGDDDKLLPNCLEEYVKLMDKYPGLGVYHAWTEIIDEKSQFSTLQQPRPEFESALSLAWNRWNGRDRQYIGDFCFEVKRLRTNGGFYKLPMAWGADDISAIIAAKDTGIANTQTICFQYRVNKLTISKTGASSVKLDALQQEKEWFVKFVTEMKCSVNLPDVDKKYLLCLDRELLERFKQRMEICLIGDMRTHRITGLVKWFRKGSLYVFGKKEILKCWLKSLV